MSLNMAITLYISKGVFGNITSEYMMCGWYMYIDPQPFNLHPQISVTALWHPDLYLAGMALKRHIWKDTEMCARLFKAVLSVIVKSGKNPDDCQLGKE